MKTITRKIQAEAAPFVLWDLYKDETTFYNRWCLEWFEDYRQTENIDLWDNDEWLQDLYDGEKKHKKEFKQFVKKHYTNVYWKEVYKEFKEIWELKDRLNKPKKGSFEVGKYYCYTFKNDDEFYFKVTRIKEGGVWGYGLDEKPKWCGSTPWCNESAYENVKEITQEQFLEKVREYATNVLGFKEGASFDCRNLIVYKKPLHTASGEPMILFNSLVIPCIDGNQYDIYRDGKFAEIVEEEDNIAINGEFTEEFLKTGKDAFWQPTMELRWRWKTVLNVETVTKQIKVLQQKWIADNGNEEWRDIE